MTFNILMLGACAALKKKKKKKKKKLLGVRGSPELLPATFSVNWMLKESKTGSAKEYFDGKLFKNAAFYNFFKIPYWYNKRQK